MNEEPKLLPYIEFPFPLRKHRPIYMKLPIDLTENEVEKIYKYLKTLSKLMVEE